jgi:ERCC4-related helicase
MGSRSTAQKQAALSLFSCVRADAAERPDLSQFCEHTSPAGYNLAFGILDAFRIKISHTYDKLSCLSNSRTRLLPHQIEATHRIVNSLKPRFILADEVGLGKTIEAGLVVKELMLRRGYERVIVSVPAPLAVQWQQEMKSKFNEDFTILTRKNFATISASWNRHKRIITSIDFIKNERYAEAVLSNRWDIAVFDEAHRLRRDYSKVTRAYAFAEKLSANVEAFLLLSATPFRGKLEELYYLVRLVDPHLLGPHSSFMQEYGKESTFDLREKLSRVLVRRRKVEVGGFTKRFATTIRFELSPEERAFYDATTEYVRREYNLAMQTKNRAIGFIMIVFQKLLDSSTRALMNALEKRRAMLERNIHSSPYLSIVAQNLSEEELDLDEIDDLEEAVESLEDEIRRSIQETRKEILTLNRLLHLGRAIGQDRKLLHLRETLVRLRKEGHKKFIIFTQFRSTQDYLGANLTDFSVTPFHGSLNMQQKEDAIREFRDLTEILICTEAGGEGRNLQFGNILINYDLPWSPLKIEQRIGRIHRFGQAKDVYIFNFSTRDTVAERVLEVLENKIRLFEESIGPSDALLGALEDEADFQGRLMEFVTGVKTKEEFDAELGEKLLLAERGYGKLNELVTPQCLDFNLDDYYSHTRGRRAVDNDEIEKLTLNYLEISGSDEYILKREESPLSKAEYTVSRKGESPRPATFRSEVALENEAFEFLAAGHPLVENALHFFLNRKDLRSIQCLPAGNGLIPGYYFIAICSFLSGLNRSELISCMVPDDGRRVPIIPDELLIRPGIRFEDLPPSLLYDADLMMDRVRIEKAREICEVLLQEEANRRALGLREKLHGIFKKEEYKLEISFGKRLRQIDEKRDRQRMRYTQNPTTEARAVLSRTEHELSRVRLEMEESIGRVRAQSNIDANIDLLQIYRIVEG